jgi:hypothetical protein
MIAVTTLDRSRRAVRVNRSEALFFVVVTLPEYFPQPQVTSFERY